MAPDTVVLQLSVEARMYIIIRNRFWIIRLKFDNRIDFDHFLSIILTLSFAKSTSQDELLKSGS